MATKAKHAFGMLENVDKALSEGLIDAYDILFTKDAAGNPHIGWIDKDGNKVIVENGQVDLTALEAKLAVKADAVEVDAKIDQAVLDAEHSYERIKYEITSKPKGTLVDYFDKEIRVMCPADTVWTKQAVGATGNANMYYMGFKAYAPDGAVSFKEGDQGVVEDEMLTFDNDFAGTDEFGRNYSIVWLALASYDEPSDTWTYFGKNSSMEKYIGWTYVVEWYDADGVLIASDSVRINLSNEECHGSIEPYYMSNALNTAKKYVDTQIEEKITEIESAYEVIEF